MQVNVVLPFCVRQSDPFDFVWIAERGQSPTEELPARAVEFDLGERLSAEQSDSDAEAWIDVDLQTPKSLLDSPGGQRVAELVGAWDGLAGRLPPGFGSSSGSPLLLAALKLTVSALQEAAPTEDGRNPLSRALSVAYVLADLRVRYILEVWDFSLLTTLTD